MVHEQAVWSKVEVMTLLQTFLLFFLPVCRCSPGPLQGLTLGTKNAKSIILINSNQQQSLSFYFFSLFCSRSSCSDLFICVMNQIRFLVCVLHSGWCLETARSDFYLTYGDMCWRKQQGMGSPAGSC